MKPGYKQTEVGVIPEDWDVARLGDIFEITSSKRIFRSDWKSRGVPFYRARELAVLGEAGMVDNELFITEELYQSFKHAYGVPSTGDMLVTGVGTLGKVYVVEKSHEFYFKDGNIIWFKIGEKFSAQFLRQLYLTPLVIKQIEEGSAGTTVGTYTITAANRTKVPVPPLLEQTAIAAALGEVDALLYGLDALIAKQRDLKTATMQQLLTGKVRLPGFGGEWEKKRLGEVLAVRHGKNQKEVEADDGDFPILATGGKIGWAKQWLYNKPSVLIGRKGTIDRPQYMDTPFWTVDTLFFTEIKETNIAQFFFYRFGLIDWMQFNEASGVPSLNARTIENIEIVCPQPEEQAVIAEVLSDMDAQLAMLEQQRAKTALIKQGMMQELLTGRARLVQSVAQPASNVVPFPKPEAKSAERQTNVHFKRSVFAAEIVERLHAEPTFGHVKFEKLIYLAEHMCKVDIGANYHLDAAGPYDNRALRSIDSQLKKSKWFDAKKVDGRYQYVPLEKHGTHKPYFDRYFANVRDAFDRVIDTFRNAKTEQCEIVATLYAAWSDLLAKSDSATDDAIVDQVLNHWHDDKKRIPEDRWRKALVWMREKDFVPEGAN